MVRSVAAEECRPGNRRWIVFDLKTEVDISKVRLVNYWSSRKSGDGATEEIVLETAPSVQGPFRVVSTHTDLPRCAVSKAVDLYIRASARVCWSVHRHARRAPASASTASTSGARRPAASRRHPGGHRRRGHGRAAAAPRHVDALKKILAWGTWPEVVDAACLQLGVAPTGSLQERPMRAGEQGTTCTSPTGEPGDSARTSPTNRLFVFHGSSFPFVQCSQMPPGQREMRRCNGSVF